MKNQCACSLRTLVLFVVVVAVFWKGAFKRNSGVPVAHAGGTSLELSLLQAVLLRHQRLNVPDALRVLVDAAVAAEEAHARHAGDALCDPLLLVLVRLVYQVVRLDVAVEVVGHQVVVTMVAHRRDHAGEIVRFTERATLDCVEHLLQVGVDRVRAVRVCVAEILNVLSEVAEKEEVVLANLTSDFDLFDRLILGKFQRTRVIIAYVGTIASPDDQTSVEHKLHVAGTGSPICTLAYQFRFVSGAVNLLCARSRNMFTQVRGRDDDLGLADIVVLQEDDFEQITDLGILVDHSSNIVDQVNNLLGHPVARSCLSTEDGDAREDLLPLFRRQGLEGEISVNCAEDVQLLTLVLVYTLDLDIEKRRGVDGNASAGLDVLGKSNLVGVLDLGPLLSEVLVVDIQLHLVELCQITQEIVASGLAGDQLRQARVGLVKPATGSDAVGHVCELVRSENLDKVLEDGSLDKVGVKLCDTIDLVRTNDGKIRHAHHLLGSFLNN